MSGAEGLGANLAEHIHGFCLRRDHLTKPIIPEDELHCGGRVVRARLLPLAFHHTLVVKTTAATLSESALNLESLRLSCTA